MYLHVGIGKPFRLKIAFRNSTILNIAHHPSTNQHTQASNTSSQRSFGKLKLRRQKSQLKKMAGHALGNPLMDDLALAAEKGKVKSLMGLQEGLMHFLISQMSKFNHSAESLQRDREWGG